MRGMRGGQVELEGKRWLPPNATTSALVRIDPASWHLESVLSLLSQCPTLAQFIPLLTLFWRSPNGSDINDVGTASRHASAAKPPL